MLAGNRTTATQVLAWSLGAVAAIAVVVSQLDSVRKSFGSGYRWLSRRLFPKRSDRRLLRRLRPGWQLERFREALGTETFVRPSGIAKQVFWSAKRYVLQAVVDEHGQVVAFLVTSLTKSLRPSWTTPVSVTLGETPYASVSTEPTGVEWWRGANNASYAELHQMPGASGFQTVILATNLFSSEFGDIPVSATAPVPADVIHRSPATRADWDEITAFLKHPTVVEFRKRGLPNTFGLTIPLWDPDSVPFSFGVEKLDAGLLRPPHD